MAKESANKVKPIVLKVANEKGAADEYTLEFDRASVKWAEQRGFKIDELSSKPLDGMETLFYYAFRMHHPTMTRQQTNDILYDTNLPEGFFERLGQLYSVPFSVMTDNSKNSRVTVEM